MNMAHSLGTFVLAALIAPGCIQPANDDEPLVPEAGLACEIPVESDIHAVTMQYWPPPRRSEIRPCVKRPGEDFDRLMRNDDTWVSEDQVRAMLSYERVTPEQAKDRQIVFPPRDYGTGWFLLKDGRWVSWTLTRDECGWLGFSTGEVIHLSATPPS